MSLNEYEVADLDSVSQKRIIQMARQTGKTSLLERIAEDPDEVERVFLSLEMTQEDIHKRLSELCADPQPPTDEERPMLRRRDLNLGKLPEEDPAPESKPQPAPPISKKDVERMEAAREKRERKKAKRKQLMAKE